MYYSHNHNDINPTVQIQMQIQGNTKHRRTLYCSVTNRLLTSEFGSSTRREGQF